jgi:hypothetical protein
MYGWGSDPLLLIAMAKSFRQRTKRLTVSAMLAAIGAVMLLIGSFLESLDLTVAALASMLCIYAVIELGGAYPWMIWGVTSLLGLLLLPYPKTPALFYLLIGFYPILKEKLEKLKRLPCLLFKLVVIHAVLGIVLLALWIFPELRELLGNVWLLLGTYAITVVTFLIYDYALTKLITFYLIRLRSRLRLK